MSANLQAVVFDWAGTMIDFGSRAPVVALLKLFDGFGLPISEAEARADMGMAKRDHIAAILAQPRVAGAWAARYGKTPDVTDGDRLFARITLLMQAAARETAVLIPGAADVVRQLRGQGVKIGSCTGYTREMMADILPAAAAQGYTPDCLVCAGDTAYGRPSPLMLWKNMVELGVWPAAAVVKVDDAAVGVAEGRSAGTWTVGVAASGNSVGLSAGALAVLPVEERAGLIAAARAELLAAGAHVVIDTVADLPAVLTGFAYG